ncbi:MAG: AI-2E family transporter [Dehalococcoidia bacterium]
MRIELTARGVFFLLLAVAGVMLLRRLWPVVILVVTALIFMGALLPYVEWLVARGVKRGVAVLLVAAAVFAGIVALFAMMVPGLISELETIRDQIPGWAEEIELRLADYGIEVDLEQRARDINWTEVLSGRAIDYTQQLLFFLFAAFTVAVMTLYLLADAPRLTRWIYQFVPSGKEADAQRLLQSMTRVVGGYIRGQTITSAIIAAYTFVVLTIVGVPNALAFAVLAGIADVIPLVGAYIAVGPQVLAASDESSTAAITVLVALLIYQQFEDRILVPRVYGATLNLPPLVVLITVLIGAELLGVVGVLLALPAAAAGRVILEYSMERRFLGLPPPPHDGEEFGTPEALANEGEQVFAPDEEPDRLAHDGGGAGS